MITGGKHKTKCGVVFFSSQQGAMIDFIQLLSRKKAGSVLGLVWSCIFKTDENNFYYALAVGDPAPPAPAGAEWRRVMGGIFFYDCDAATVNESEFL